MNNKMVNSNNRKKVIIGTVVSISVCALFFSILTSLIKAAILNKTELIPTTYSAPVINKKHEVPKGYIKTDYKVKLMDSARQHTAKDMPAEKAAEFGAQELWKLFGADLSGQTIEMSYNAVSYISLNPEWQGIVKVNDNLLYLFTVDAITGMYRMSNHQKFWDGDIKIDEDKDLANNPIQYTTLAKEVAKKYQLVSGEIISSKYGSQGYMRRYDAKSPHISIMITSENGEQAELTFSRYNQELLVVTYDNSIKEQKAYDDQIQRLTK